MVTKIVATNYKPAASMVEAWRGRMMGLRDRVVILEIAAHSLATRLSLRADLKPGETERFAADVGQVSDDLAKLHGEIARAYPPAEAKKVWHSLGADASIMTFGWLESRDLAVIGRQVKYFLEKQNRRLFDVSAPAAMQELDRRLRGG